MKMETDKDRVKDFSLYHGCCSLANQVAQFQVYKHLQGSVTTLL